MADTYIKASLQFNFSMDFTSNQGLVANFGQTENAAAVVSGSGPAGGAENLSDRTDISIKSKAFDFFRTSLVNQGVSNETIQASAERFLGDPAFNAELERLYILLGNLYKDDPEVKESIEKFFSALASGHQIMSGARAGGWLRNVNDMISRVAAGGAAESASVQVVSSNSVEIEIVIENGEVRGARPRKTDPLVIDIDGDGLELTNADKGVNFDIDGDGNLERTSVTASDDGMLALDKNGNGAIDDGRELFGDQNGAKTGFEELAKYDENGDNVIDSKDSIFDELKVLRYKKSEFGIMYQRLTSLKSLGIEKIDLSSIIEDKAEINGNDITHKGFIYSKDGGFKTIAEAFFENYRI